MCTHEKSTGRIKAQLCLSSDGNEKLQFNQQRCFMLTVEHVREGKLFSNLRNLESKEKQRGIWNDLDMHLRCQFESMQIFNATHDRWVGCLSLKACMVMQSICFWCCSNCWGVDGWGLAVVPCRAFQCHHSLFQVLYSGVCLRITFIVLRNELLMHMTLSCWTCCAIYVTPKS